MPLAQTLPSDFGWTPFTIADAQKQGLSRKVLRGSRFTRLLRGVYIRSDADVDERVRLQAGQLVVPSGSVVSHLSAARLYGFEPRVNRGLEFSTNQHLVSEHVDVALHRRQAPIVAYDVDGMRVTGPDRTFVDCCHCLPFVKRVQLADHLLHVGATTLPTLIEYCESRHLHGVQRARQTVVYASGRAESPRETLIRLMLRCARLPVALANEPVDEHASARADLLYRAYMVIVEYDGWYHERSAAQRQRDRARLEYLASLGYRVMVVFDEDLRDPSDVVWRVYRGLVDQGYTGPAPVLSASWHRWFDRAYRL